MLGFIIAAATEYFTGQGILGQIGLMALFNLGLHFLGKQANLVEHML